MNDLIQESLEQAFERAKNGLGKGSVASYIPELAKVNSELLGATIYTKVGDYYQIGDADHLFSIQSISKTILLIHALMVLGAEKVFKVVGMEATGDAFNSIVKLETRDNHPLNPFINAGAIAVAGLLDANGCKFEDSLEIIRTVCKNKTINYSQSVFESERETGNVNRSIAYLLKSDNIIEKSVDSALEYYFKACSVMCNTKDLAIFAMLLANDGEDLVSKQQVIPKDIVRQVKTLMVTAGMYDKSGTHAMKVGMPSKSGVGGGIIASGQHRMGIAVFGPELDKTGNSVGGQIILEELSRRLKLHFFD